MSTCRTFIEICVSGHSCERDVTLEYEYRRADGDGWNEPRYPAGVTLTGAEVVVLYPGLQSKRLDVMPLLTKECIESIETELLERHEQGLERDPDYERDMRSDLPF